MSPSRRVFLKQVSAATAFGMLYQIPGRALWAVTPGELVPEPDEALMRELALVALDAARSAGAAFADVRVTGMRSFKWGTGFRRDALRRPFMSSTLLETNVKFTTGYGVRAMVDGAWGFAGDHTLNREAVAEVARRAVSRARANRPRRARNLELAPVSRVENGEWEPVIQQDPFTVPVGEQADLALAALVVAEGVRGVNWGHVGAGWEQTTNVFASSEGSLTAQRVTRGGANASASGRSRDDHRFRGERVESLVSGWYGYEALSAVDLVTELRAAAERAVANSQRPAEHFPVSVDVGRYDLVMSGYALLKVLEATLGPALNLERALGYRANQEGTSFAAPPREILGNYQVGSPLLTLRADRTRPHALASVGWDDEGVPAGDHTLIEDGVIVDYLTSRQTAMELASSYKTLSEAVQSRGCMVGSGERRPEISLPNLTVEPGKEDVSLDDLIADTKRGFYVPDADGGSDQQLLSGQFAGREVVEIRNGKLARPIKDFAFQFLTPQFWKNLDVLGGPATMVEWGRSERRGMVEQHNYSNSLRAPAARVRELNVLNTGIKL